MTSQKHDNQAVILEEALTRFVDECLQGKQPDVDEFVKLYPQCEAQLKLRLQDLEQIDSLFDSLVRADESDFEDAEAVHSLVGRKFGSFEVVKMIGRGGTGVVHLARDTRLGRSVAIKSVSPKLVSDSTTRTRFRREARLLASLNHPNIAAIHDIIEQDESTDYLILEYVPGQTLAQHIGHKPLKFKEALSIGLQIADAVAAAHDKGVIHRDLKPGNIKITPEDKVKVLDFGLGKVNIGEGAGGDITATQSGHVVGTPAYMSPEQARGESTDHLTDIWSFGCIMYEMLTGHSPFESDTATDTLARIIEREPNWELLPQETPENIKIILHRCLEKDPHNRLRDIRDVAIEIKGSLDSSATAVTTMPATSRRAMRRWAIVTGFVVVAFVIFLTVVGPNIDTWRKRLLGGASTSRIKALAVLPLQNLTGDPNQEYFADGMTDSLIADLGKIGALQVRSRTSIMQYKDVKKPLSAIARELNVDAVVEGSVIRIGEQVRITAQLIHAPTDTHLWADSYEADLRDILTLLSKMARTIARQVEITVTPDQEALLAAGTRPVNPETYDAYLKGMFFMNKFTPEGAEKGLHYLRQAIEKDPADPLAYGGLALGYAMSAHNPSAPPDAHARATEAALKALELDENVAEAHAALALNRVYGDWDLAGAEHAFQRALELNTNLTEIRAHYSFYLLIFGRTDEASAQMNQALEMDPLVPIYYAWQGWQYWWIGQDDEAIAEARKSLELDSDFPVGLYVLGSAYAEKGMYEEAIKAHQRAGEISRVWKSALGRTYAMAGRQDEARAMLAELEADFTTWDTWFIAQIYAVLGEKDEAFRWLEAAFDMPHHHPYVPWIKFPPAFKSLHNDPRYAEMLRRMGLPE